MDKVKAVMQNKVSRRKFIGGVSAGMGAAAAVSFAAGCGGGNSTPPPNPTPVSAPTVTDVDILNFALNLEYLEAEFYLRAATGTGLSTADAGSGAGSVNGGVPVPFTTDAVGTAIKQYAIEVAADEQLHVEFLRSAITAAGATPASRPAIDFTAGFTGLATAAKLPMINGAVFNPFADQFSFLVGAFTFEDVGVTAYNGAGPLLTSKTNLSAAGSIVAVEAYHAGLIRTLLVQNGAPFLTYANQISAVRAAATSVVTGAPAGGDEVALSPTTIVPADSNSLAYSRTTDQVLHIVYLAATAGVVTKGGFYPNGLTGNITASAS